MAAVTAVLGLVLSLAGVAVSPPAAALTPVAVERLAGADRYETARQTALAAFPGGSPDVLLATGTNFPDALASSYLAGVLGAPVLLTPPDQLSSAAEAALATLAATDVTVLGSVTAVSADVTSRLASLGYTVHRIGGADRFATSALIATSQPTVPVGTSGGQRTAIVASGSTFPDALAGGPVAFDFGFPVLLTAPDALPGAVSQALQDLAIQRVLLLGGPAAVTSGVQSSIAALGITVQRIEGPDRFATAAAIARHAQTSLGWTPTQLILATGRNFPDALAAGPLGGSRQAPIALTDDLVTIPPATGQLCADLEPTVNRLQVQGSASVVSDPVVQQCKAALEGGAPPGCSAPGATDNLFGHARVDGLTATPTVSRPHNSRGGATTVSRAGTGSYVVTFDCLGTSQGIAHVSAVGPTTTSHCNAGPWAPAGTAAVEVQVVCHDSAGNAADTNFDVLFSRPVSSSTPLAQVWYRFGAGLDPLPPGNQFNSTGFGNSVLRMAAGEYQVDLQGLAPSPIGSGNVIVSSFGANPGGCYVRSWTPSGSNQRVQVACTDQAGTPTDRTFMLTFSDRGPVAAGHTGPAAHVWASPAVPPAPYAPVAEHAFNSAGPGGITVERTATGSYRFTLDGLASASGFAQVTPYVQDVACMVDVNDPSGTKQLIEVFCFDRGTAAPRDTQVTLAYLG